MVFKQIDNNTIRKFRAKKNMQKTDREKSIRKSAKTQFQWSNKRR